MSQAVAAAQGNYHAALKLTREQIATEKAANLERRLRRTSAKEDATKEQAASSDDRQTSVSVVSVEKLTKKQTTVRQATSSDNERALTKEQIDSELQELETVTAAAARDCVSLTCIANMTKASWPMQQISDEILELAMEVQNLKETVCGRATYLLRQLKITEAASRDAGELQYVKTAMQNVLDIVNAFMAAFEASRRTATSHEGGR